MTPSRFTQMRGPPRCAERRFIGSRGEGRLANPRRGKVDNFTARTDVSLITIFSTSSVVVANQTIMLPLARILESSAPRIALGSFAKCNDERVPVRGGGFVKRLDRGNAVIHTRVDNPGCI